MTDGPDLQGMREAQATLRQYTGEDVIFYTPTGEEWPPGTVLDPQTGRPYDPLIDPIASGWGSAAVRANLAFRPVSGLNDQTAETPLGNLELGQIVAIMDIDDAKAVADATEFDAKGDHYKITQRKDDGIGSNYRTLVWGERMEDSWT
jgi:hypothetical protein